MEFILYSIVFLSKLQKYKIPLVLFSLNFASRYFMENVEKKVIDVVTNVMREIELQIIVANTKYFVSKGESEMNKC